MFELLRGTSLYMICWIRDKYSGFFPQLYYIFLRPVWLLISPCIFPAVLSCNALNVLILAVEKFKKLDLILTHSWIKFVSIIYPIFIHKAQKQQLFHKTGNFSFLLSINNQSLDSLSNYSKTAWPVDDKS